MMKIARITAAGFVLLLTAQTLAAQVPNPTKRELIKELIAVTEVRKTAGKTVDVILAEMSRQYPKMIASVADADTDLTLEQRQKMKALAGESYTRFAKAFRERLQQRIDLGQLAEEVSYTLYDKYFSEDEIKDLTAFYRTPTGKKALSVLPQLFAESIQQTSEKLTPVLTSLILEIVNEEKDRMKRPQ